MTRTYKIDAIRAVACFCVVVIHVSASRVSEADEASLSWWLANLLQSLVFWAVPAFFMISGYFLLAPATQTLREYFHARAWRVMAPSALWILAYGAWDHFVYGHPNTWPQFARSVATGNVSVHLYFVFSLVGIYCIAPFLRTFFVSVDTSYILGFGYLLTAASALDYGVSRALNEWRGNAASLPIQFLGYFVLGYAYRRLQESGRSRQKLWLALLTLGWVFYVIGKYMEAARTSGGIVFYYSNSYFSVPLVLISISVFPIMLETAMLDWVGRLRSVQVISSAAFGIYLIHVALLDALYQIAKVRHPITITGMLGHAFPVFLIAFAVTVAAQSIPGLRWVFSGPNVGLLRKVADGRPPDLPSAACS